MSIKPTKTTATPLEDVASVVPSYPRVRSLKTFSVLVPYSIFSLPINTVPLAGNPLESATGIDELIIVRSAPVVEAAVSNRAALVSMKEVTLASMPPLSLRVVCE